MGSPGKTLSRWNREPDRLRGARSHATVGRGEALLPSMPLVGTRRPGHQHALNPPQAQGHTIWVKAMVGPLWSSKRSMVLRLRIMCKP